MINKSEITITDKEISIDFGIVNFVTIYDPHGKQYIISGKPLIAINTYYNNKINNAELLLKKEKSSTKIVHQESSKLFSKMNKKCDKIIKQIRILSAQKENKINNYINKTITWILTTYSNYKRIIIGHNNYWKGNNFDQFLYNKFLNKLKNGLEKNNKELKLVDESYTSKCDALALEEICRKEQYFGTRPTRGLFMSSIGKMINADLNAAINIMRKWKIQNGIKLKEITGENIFNPEKIKIV